MESHTPSDAHSPQDEAFRRVLAHRTMLKVHILCIVHDPHLAEDTFSDATLAIVRSWHTYDPSKPFEPWARGVARNVALANLRKHRREAVSLDESVLEALGGVLDAEGGEAELDWKKQSLHDCVAKLPSHSRELVRWRYFEDQPHTDIAARTKRNISALYMTFSRIHAALADCMRPKSPTI